MATKNIDGLIALRNAVAAAFTANAITAPGGSSPSLGTPIPVIVQPVGLKNRSPWTAPRVVFIPGKFNGSLASGPIEEGTLDPPEHSKSTNPRELVTWRRLVTLSVFSCDTTDLQDESLQIQAVTDLLETTIGLIKRAFIPNLAPSSPEARELGYTGQQGAYFDGAPVTRVIPPTEFAYGAELLVTFTQLSVLFDPPDPEVTPEFVLSHSFQPPPPPTPPPYFPD